MSTQVEVQVPICIVGGGVVGLSASLLLSHHGIQHLLVERRAGTSIHPRSRGINARTMEIFRGLELEDRIRQAGASLSSTMGIYNGASLKDVIGAKPRTEGPRAFPLAGLFAPVSSTVGAFVTQDMLEPLLLETAKERGGDIRFCTECVDLVQDHGGITAKVKDRDSGVITTVRADFLIAADGVSSPIRIQLGIPFTGRGTLGYMLNILFHADLKSFVKGREFSICVIDRPEVLGGFVSINNDNRWIFHLAYDPSKGEKVADFSREKCSELVRLALGMPDIEIDIESILPWEPSVRIAETLQKGRVFLAGDAAHQMPPWAGQGANSGIADVHNLAWKLAAVLKGYASKALLETYNVERLPVGRAAAEVSADAADSRGIISTKRNLTNAKKLFRRAHLISGHGYRYTGKAFCTEDTFPLGGITWRPWTVPSLVFAIDGSPGSRAPHLWVQHLDKRISTLDLFGKNFVLLTGPMGISWVQAVKNLPHIEVDAFCVGPNGDLVAPAGAFESAASITSHGVILVRPDGFVVWRERRHQPDQMAKLEWAIRQAMPA